MRIVTLVLTFGLLLAVLAPASAQAEGAAARSLAPPPPDQGTGSSIWPGQTFRFEHLGIQDGLSQSTVTAILQDRRGFLWFGTEDGLNHYDGYTFKVFKPNPDDPFSISERWINALYEDRAGNLWIGTRLGGLNRYDPKQGRFTRYLHDSTDPNSLSSNTVNAIYEDANGILWVGTEAGLDWLDPATGAITHIRSDPEDESALVGRVIKAIHGDKRGFIWVGTQDAGLNRYSPETRAFVRYQYNQSRKNRICSSSVDAIVETLDGLLWLASPGGLTRFNPGNEFATCYRNDPQDPDTISSNTIETLFVDHTGHLWVGTARGLDQYVGSSNTFIHFTHNPAIPDSLSAETVYSIYEDRGGVLWVGVYGGGVNKHDQTQERFAYFRHDPDNPDSLSDSFVMPIHVDREGHVWVGTYGGGLNRFDPVTGVFTRFVNRPSDPTSLPSNYVWSIYSDSQGFLWVGTSKGLSRMDPQTGLFTAYAYASESSEATAPGAVLAMTEDLDGNLWLGTRDGVGRFDRDLGLFLPEEFKSPTAPAAGYRVVSLFTDKDGILWIGTMENGLYRYDIKRRELKEYRSGTEPGSLSHDSVFAITQDDKQTIWVATGGGGLNRYDPLTNSFKAYTEKEGLANNVVYGILKDYSGNLWLSTNYGISRFNPYTETFRNYTVSDGLGNMEFNMGAFAKSPSGAMYFGSINGLNAFYPDHILDNTYVPPVALTSLTHEGKPLAPDTTPETTGEIVLRPPQNSFEFEFSALSFTATNRNQYAYKLEGWDQDWYYLGNKRNGRYTNLPGGAYTLRLKASNSDGVWNEDSLAIPVTVIPPFWQTWWFRVSLGFGLALLALAGYGVRIRQMKNRNVELEALVRARTTEIEKLFEQTKELAVVEERNRLARDLHDSAKQKAFAALAQLGTVHSLALESPAARKHLKEAENLVAEVIQELTFLIQEMYPISLMENGLPATIREYVFEWENRNSIQADVNITSPRALDLKLEQAIYRVIQEALANVARHSRAERVNVELDYGPDRLVVVVTDDGCGFDGRTRPPGLGLRSIRERIQSVSGWVRIESVPGRGTRLTVEVPLDASVEVEVEKESIHEEVHLHPDR